jgi:hypothetical protein
MYSCVLATGFAAAQPPGGRERASSAGDAASFIARLLAFDENNDGKLSKAEVTDERLQPLFERIDANNDGVVTKDEMTAFFTKESASLNAAGRGGPAGGPGGFGPPVGGNRPGAGPNGPGNNAPGGNGSRRGGPVGFNGPPQPGQIMPNFMQEALQLTETQKKQLDKLQQDVDVRLSKILNENQKQQINEMQNRAASDFGPPGGPGPGPGGRGGPGGPGGPTNGPGGFGNGPGGPPRGPGAPNGPPQP